MVVQRDIFKVKQGKMMAVLDLVKQARDIISVDGNLRIYTDFVGQQNTMAVEIEHDNLAAFEEAYQAAFENKELVQIFEQFPELTTGNGKTEIWHLHS